MGNGCAGIQPALGMGDDIHLLAPGLLHDLPDPRGQFPAAVLHRGGGLLLTVKHLRSVALQFSGNPSPIVEVFEVPEENAMYKQNGISGLADLTFRPYLIQFPFFRFQLRFPACQAHDLHEIPDIHTGNPPHQRCKDAGLDPQLYGCQVNTDHAVPENDSLRQHAPEDAGRSCQHSLAAKRLVLSSLHPEGALQNHAGCGRYQKLPQQCAAGFQLPQAAGRPAGANGPDIDKKKRRHRQQGDEIDRLPRAKHPRQHQGVRRRQDYQNRKDLSDHRNASFFFGSVKFCSSMAT